LLHSVKKCKFDVQACSQFCPLGYVADSDGCVSGCACNPKGLFQGDIQFSETDVPTVMKVCQIFVFLYS